MAAFVRQGEERIAAAANKVKNNMRYKIALALIGIFGCTGCGSSVGHAITAAVASPVDVVKNGFLPGYTSASAGKAFGGKFTGGVWKSFVTKKGQTVVEFDGTASSLDLRKAGFFPKIEECKNILQGHGREDYFFCLNHYHAVPITFQFTVGADKTSFDITYYGEGTFEGPQSRRSTRDEVLDFIYERKVIVDLDPISGNRFAHVRERTDRLPLPRENRMSFADMDK